MLGIARRELHDKIVDLVKRKLLATEPEPENLVEVRAALLDEVATKDELAEKSLYKAALGMSNDIKPSSYRGYDRRLKPTSSDQTLVGNPLKEGRN